MSREKIEMDVHFESTMDAIVRTLESARMSKGSDNPQVFEVKFKLPNMGYSSRSDFYRLVFDPNHLDNLGFAGDTLFLYQGDRFFDKMLGMVGIQKNEKAIIVRQFWFDQKMTKTFRDEDMEFEKITHYDAQVPENYMKVVKMSEELPF